MEKFEKLMDRNFTPVEWKLGSFEVRSNRTKERVQVCLLSCVLIGWKIVCVKLLFYWAVTVCGVKKLIAAYIWRNPNSSNSHPHRICNFRTLSSGSDSNADDQYSHLKRFIVRDLTDWANENHTYIKPQIARFEIGFAICILIIEASLFLYIFLFN